MGVTVDPGHAPVGLRARLVEALRHRGFGPPTPRWLAWAGTAFALAGAALTVTTAAIHLHLWLTGYRHVATLGVLFLLQAITGFVLGPLIAIGRYLVLLLAGAGFMASSVVGLLLSATVGFVGIHDDLTTPWATPSLVVELAGFVLLGTAAAISAKPLLRTR